MARKQGKKYASAAQQIERRPYTLEEAVPLVQRLKFAKFDETVEAVVARFGAAFRSASGGIDRVALGKIVFSAVVANQQ